MSSRRRVGCFRQTRWNNNKRFIRIRLMGETKPNCSTSSPSDNTRSLDPGRKTLPVILLYDLKMALESLRKAGGGKVLQVPERYKPPVSWWDLTNVIFWDLGTLGLQITLEAAFELDRMYPALVTISNLRSLETEKHVPRCLYWSTKTS